MLNANISWLGCSGSTIARVMQLLPEEPIQEPFVACLNMR